MAMMGKGRLLPEKAQEDLLALLKVHITQNTYMILKPLFRNPLYGLARGDNKTEDSFPKDEKAEANLIYLSRTLDQFSVAH